MGARNADSIEAARIILVNAVERLPAVAIFHYNLAYYECQLANLEESKGRLKRAFELEPRYRMKALEDEDLEGVMYQRPMELAALAGSRFNFYRLC
jgi:hypothetical protein